jgi:hypothetical protein
MPAGTEDEDMNLRWFAWMAVASGFMFGTINGWMYLFRGGSDLLILSTAHGGFALVILMLLKPEWFRRDGE